MTIEYPAKPRPLQRLAEWWETARGKTPMPPRSALDPGDLRDVLPFLFIVDARPDPATGARPFTYRLTGSELDECLGVNLTGRPLDAVPFDGERVAIRDQYERVVAERRPVRCAHRIIVDGRRCVEYERLVVPLAGEAPGEIVALLGAIDVKCAYSLPCGRPADCPGGKRCRRNSFCVDPRAALLMR